MADGREVRAVLTQPKRLALLAYLAAAPPGGFHRRDALLALFWPDCTERQARLALRQALHHLRVALGAAVIANRGGSELGLAPGVLWCDVTAFRRALCDGEHVEALELYRGDLLEAFSVHGISIELERWLEEERLALRALAFGSASALSERAARDGELALAIHWARRALALSSGAEPALRRLVEMLDLYGDRAGALRAAESFARRLREELDAEPAPETTALLAGIRARDAARPGTSRPEPAPGDAHAGKEPPARSRDTPVSSPVITPAVKRIPSAPDDRSRTAEQRTGRPRTRDVLRRRAAAGAGLVILAAVIGGVAAARDRGARQAAPTIAVGWIDQWGGEDEKVMSRFLPSLLETELARIPGQRTVSSARVHELLGRLGSRVATPGAVTNAARLAGATELIEGALYHTTTVAALRLDLRRVSLGTGVVLRAYEVRGATPFELASRAAALIASDPELARPLHSAAEPASGSPAYLGADEGGQRGYYQIDPDDPVAQLGMASALVDAGMFEEATPFYRRVIDLDSIALRGASQRCRACDAEEALIRTYWAADSFAAAGRAARAWIHVQPGSRRAWSLLAETYQRVDRDDDARAVRAAAVRLSPAKSGYEDDAYERALAAIRRGDFGAADAYFTLRARGGGRGERQAALWWLIISLRNQGRLDAAMAAANRYQKMAAAEEPRGSVAAAIPRAQVMFEQGHFRAAAALFDSMAKELPRRTGALPGMSARERCWAFTLEAASLAALGDTAAVAALADSVERIGALSAYGLDRRLHLNLRGLLAWVRQDRPAAEASLRLGLHSVTEGYTRTNLQLARLLLAEHRPREAVAILQPALRGPLDANNYYVTRTELHEALAEAFSILGEPDSAAAHDRQVLRAWAHADPGFADRLDRARARLASAERMPATR